MAESEIPRMRWWGWGDPEHPSALPGEALSFLSDAVGALPRPRPPVALSRVQLAPSALSEATLDRLRAIVGSEHVRADRSERVLHAAGKGYPDLVRMRAGEPLPASTLFRVGTVITATRARLQISTTRRRTL